MPLRASFKRWAMTTTSSRAAGDLAESPKSTDSATARELTTMKPKAAAALGAAARNDNLNMKNSAKAEWIATAPVARQVIAQGKASAQGRRAAAARLRNGGSNRRIVRRRNALRSGANQGRDIKCMTKRRRYNLCEGGT